jgi:hypothetical protein
MDSSLALPTRSGRARSSPVLKEAMQLNTERNARRRSVEDELLSDGLMVHRLILQNARIVIVALGVLSLPPFALLLIVLIDR